MDIFRSYRPLPDAPWDRAAAAHLARRAGFGAYGAALDHLVQLGPEAAVAHFVDAPVETPDLDAEIAAIGSALDVHAGGPGAYGRESTDRLRRWWIYRMVRTPTPLVEKLALLWHDHFAVQEGIVIRTALLLEQNRTFRRLALAPYQDLLRAVARDPAMLVFLDNRLSSKESPNENWARELVELFTLGVDQYSQTDVRELSRIFTGWTTPAAHIAEFRFEPTMHDDGDKQLFGARIAGRTGARGIAEGEEALALILAQPAHAEFLARKLLEWFGHREPALDTVEAFAQVLRKNGGSIRESLRVLFSSAWFFAPEQRHAIYKNPVELVVGAARGAEVGNPHLANLEHHAVALGMELFEPPSVAGWEHGSAWVRTGSVAPRLNFALAVAELPHAARTVTGRATVNLDELAAQAGEGPRNLAAALAERFLQQNLEPDQEAALVEYLDAARANAPDERTGRREGVRAALHLLLAAPQFTLA